MPPHTPKGSGCWLPSRKTVILAVLCLVVFVAGSHAELYVITHLPYGGSWGSRIVIANPGNETVRGELRFFSQNGQPVEVPLGGGELKDSHLFEIGPNAVQSLEVDARESGSEWQVAWATAETSAPLQISSFFGSRPSLGQHNLFPDTLAPAVRPDEPPGRPSCVPPDPGSGRPSCIPPSVPGTTPRVSSQISTVASTVSLPKGRSFQAPVSIHSSMRLNARVAFANPNETTATVRVMLVRPEGYESVSRTVQVSPYGQVTGLLTDRGLFELELDPSVRFQGSIIICSDVPIGMLALGLDGNFTYTLPVATGIRCPGETRKTEDQRK